MGVTELPDRHKGDGLTVRQRRVLEVIRNSVDRRGYPPSMREIGDAVGLASPSSVSHQLNALVSKGYLRRDPNRPRAIEIVSPRQSVTRLVRRCRWYVANGVAAALLVDPGDLSIIVFRPGGHTAALREADEIDLSDVVPGLRFPVEAVFRSLKADYWPA